jgi:hypothetical protein
MNTAEDMGPVMPEPKSNPTGDMMSKMDDMMAMMQQMMQMIQSMMGGGQSAGA